MNLKYLVAFPIAVGAGAQIGMADGTLATESAVPVGTTVAILAVGGVLAFGAFQYLRKKRSSNMRRGVVKWFNPNKGFGFIEQEQGEDLFVHRTEIRNRRFRSLNKDDQVEFEIGRGKKGPVAKNVRKVPARKSIFQAYGRTGQATNAS